MSTLIPVWRVWGALAFATLSATSVLHGQSGSTSAARSGDTYCGLGRSNPASDTGVKKLLDGVIAAAGRNRTLVRTPTFSFAMAREYGRLGTERRDSGFTLIRRDTVRRTGPRSWRYVPPHAGDPPLAGDGMGDVVNLVELADIADSAFLDRHCWQPRGMELVHGQRLRRIDIRPLPGASAPDITGSVFLDSATDRLVRTVFDLTRIYVPTGEIVAQRISIETLYGEQAPGVPIASEVETVVDRTVTPQCVPAGFSVTCPSEVRLATRERLRLIGTSGGSP